MGNQPRGRPPTPMFVDGWCRFYTAVIAINRLFGANYGDKAKIPFELSSHIARVYARA